MALEEHRSLLFERIGVDLSARTIEKGWCGACQESQMRQAFTTYVVESFNDEIVFWPPPFLTKGMSVQEVMGYLELFDPFEYIVEGGCDWEGQCLSVTNQIVETTRKLVEVSFKGLCLQCVKKDCVEECALAIPRDPWTGQVTGLFCGQSSHRMEARLRV